MSERIKCLHKQIDEIKYIVECRERGLKTGKGWTIAMMFNDYCQSFCSAVEKFRTEKNQEWDEEAKARGYK
jgi:hypothetical protein